MLDCLSWAAVRFVEQTKWNLRLFKNCLQSRPAGLRQCFRAEFPASRHLRSFANRVVHTSKQGVRGTAHFTRPLPKQFGPEFLRKQSPQFRQIPGEYFNRVVNVENILHPFFAVACILNQNLLSYKTYWICYLHLLRRCEWVSVALAQTYAPRCEQ